MYNKMNLPYSLDAFEPFISKETMNIHYNKLYQGYVNRLNDILKSNNFTNPYPITDIFKNISDFPLSDRANIIYNAGGVINHELYFNSLTRDNSILKEPLKSALIKQYGSIENFKNELMKKADFLTGSGYTFLTLNRKKELFLLNLSNQDIPYMYNLIPIMAVDVWEHAYFLDQFNERGKYLDNYIRFINYDYINNNYIKAIEYINKYNGYIMEE